MIRDRPALVGRDSWRSQLALSVAGGLAFAAFGLGVLAPGAAARANADPLPVVAGVLGLTALAAASARWNDGLLVSWLLVFVPFAAWTWQALDPTLGSVHDSPVDALEVALYPATLAFGTAGYVAGRVAATVRDAEATGAFADGESVLLGRDPELVARHLRLAGGLFVAGVVVVAAATRAGPAVREVAGSLFYPVLLVSDGSPLAVPVILAWIAVSGWSADRIGVFPSGWALVFGPVFGALPPNSVIDGSAATGAVSDAFLALVTALVVATAFGIIGFVTGAVARHAP